ncbi:tetratricopeptide repeat-containing sensor histidine kinase [Polluticaenibacter yanchengensis]|uniref:histidine kinase n=1 Tax=Polluticaenibacter yanchengensis TaxID=3014562 RepID=A0ABT4UFT0_9BACT|nr:tetratricopeptide repeat protein [Chitinophagaceae bacterium LY-5]
MKTLLTLIICFSSLFLSGQDTIGSDTALANKLEQALQLLNNYKTEEAALLFKQLTIADVQKKQPDVYIKAALNLGRIYGDRGENVLAMQHYQDALNTAETANKKKAVPHILKNMGVLYVSWKKFDKATEYYDKAIVIAKENEDDELIADCENNKGIVSEQLNKYDEALELYKSALAIYIDKNIPEKVAMAYSNIAIVHKFQKNYTQSIEYNLKAISISEKLNDKWSMAATYNNIGNLYGEMGDYKKAIEYCEKALALAKEIDAGEIIESTYDSMAEAAAKAGDYKNAFAYHKLFSEALNQFINTENTKQLTELNIKYETERKQNIINQQQFEIKQKNNWLLFGAILFLILLLAIYFIYKNYKNKQERLLQKEVFRQQELAAKSLFEGEQKERIRIARDLHDSVGQMLSLVKMNLSSFNKTEDTANVQQLVDKTIDEIRNISHNLIPEELNFGIVPALENLSDKVNQTTSLKMTVNIAEDIRQITFQKQNELSIYRVVQEILNNMIKHADASIIDLSMNKVNELLYLVIKDNGKGMSDDAISNAKGIGWKNIFTRVRLMDGTINIASGKLNGTQIDITIPQNG